MMSLSAYVRGRRQLVVEVSLCLCKLAALRLLHHILYDEASFSGDPRLDQHLLRSCNRPLLE